MSCIGNFLVKLFLFVSLGLYLYDYTGDVLLNIKLKENCQENYFIASLAIISCSFIYTFIVSLTDYVNQEKEREKFSLLGAIFPPLYFIIQSIKELIYGTEEQSETIKLKTHKMKFCEAVMESFPQMILQFHLLLNHGLADDMSTRIIQIASIVGSILSLLFNFSCRHAYLLCGKNPILFVTCKIPIQQYLKTTSKI